MKKLTFLNRVYRLFIIAATSALVAALLANAAAADRIKREIVAIDRTGSTTQVASWSTEVGGIARDEAEHAIAAGIDELTIISIGANTADTAKVAEINLDIDCTNANACADDEKALANQIGEVAAQIASVPVDKSGSDLIAALQTARAICGRARCKITLISDGQDSALAFANDPTTLAQQVAPEIGSLKRSVVHLIGLGSDGAPTESVARAKTFFTVLLSTLHARDIQIARSL